MKKLLPLTLGFVFLFTTFALAGSPKVITLKDGTRVSGRIVGIDNGQYVVETSSVGEIKVKEDDVVSMVEPGTNVSAGGVNVSVPQNDYSAQMKSVQAQIMNNPETMQDIQAMMSDPEIMEALKDPNFIAAVQSGNPEAVQNSPQYQKLLENPSMQRMMEKIKSQQ